MNIDDVVRDSSLTSCINMFRGSQDKYVSGLFSSFFSESNFSLC